MVLPKSDYSHLIERQEEIQQQSFQIVNQAEADRRDLTNDETAQIDALSAEFEKIDESIERYKVVNTMGERFKGGGGRRTTNDDSFSDSYRNSSAIKAWGHGGGYQRDSRYRNLFTNVDSDMHGFKDGRDYFQAVFGALTGTYDPRIRNAAASSTTEGASGGFFMPHPVVAGLFDAAVAQSVLLPRVRTVPVTAKTTTFPRFQMTDRSVGLLGGFRGHWVGEGVASATVEKANIAALNVTTNKLRIDSAVTSELLQDSPMFVAEFEPALARAAAYSLDAALVRGNGAGQPLGLLSDPSSVTVAAEGSQIADSFLYANVAKMYAAMYGGGLNRAVWLVHPSVLPLLIQQQNVVKNVAGTENVGGSSVVSFNADGTLSLLSRPVLPCEHMNSIGDLGDIAFVDLTQYGLFMRKEAYVETNNATYWTSDEIAFRLLMRGTGQGLWEDVGKRPNNGGNESWLVLLGAR